MANMSYCRFENTYKDLLDCQAALQDSGGVENYTEEANEYERKYVKKLVELCKEISEEFEEEE
jgi:hypothetical protein